MSRRPRCEPLTSTPDGVVAQRLNLPRLVRAQKTPGKYATEGGKTPLLATLATWGPPCALLTRAVSGIAGDRAGLTQSRGAPLPRLKRPAGMVRPEVRHRRRGVYACTGRAGGAFKCCDRFAGRILLSWGLLDIDPDLLFVTAIPQCSTRVVIASPDCLAASGEECQFPQFSLSGHFFQRS